MERLNFEDLPEEIHEKMLHESNNLNKVNRSLYRINRPYTYRVPKQISINNTYIITHDCEIIEILVASNIHKIYEYIAKQYKARISPISLILDNEIIYLKDHIGKSDELYDKYAYILTDLYKDDINAVTRAVEGIFEFEQEQYITLLQITQEQPLIFI
jgi:hypothetical protein